MEKHINAPFPSTNDFVREDIHASGFFMPVIASLIGVPTVGTLIFAIAVIYTVSETLAFRRQKIATYFSNHCDMPLHNQSFMVLLQLPLLCFRYSLHLGCFSSSCKLRCNRNVLLRRQHRITLRRVSFNGLAF